MKRIKFTVNDDIGDAFYNFCKETDTTPEEMIETLVNLFGSAQTAWGGLRKGEISQEEAITYMRNMTADAIKLYSHMIIPMAYPLFYKLQRDLLKSIASPGHRAEPFTRAALERGLE
jgi:hypothetical protein